MNNNINCESCGNYICECEQIIKEQEGLERIEEACNPPENWHESYANIVELVTCLEKLEFFLWPIDVVRVIEKPWNYTREYALGQLAQLKPEWYERCREAVDEPETTAEQVAQEFGVVFGVNRSRSN